MPFDFPDLIASLGPRGLFVSAPLYDDNFEVSGVRDCVAAAMPVYETLDAGDRLVAVYPDTGHDFPVNERKAAYAFIDAALQSK
jgi:hypothetical protein